MKKPTDKQRLDWLEGHQALVNVAGNGQPHVCADQNNPDDLNHFYGSSYREAIDQAMKHFSKTRGLEAAVKKGRK